MGDTVESLRVSNVQKSENLRVLVAFGNGGTVQQPVARLCAPAPQARLRHRLQRV